MVFPDFSSEQNNPTKSTFAPAHLMDRFFSFVIDYLVLSPFVLFFLYLTFRNGFDFWRSHPLAPENFLFLIIASFVYVLYFSVLQSLFVAVVKATPGQFFLKIQFDFGETESFIFFRILLRQIGFWFSFLFLAIPFLSVMTNRSRRTFYDRIADVTVVSRKDSEVHLGFEKEYRYWQSFTVTLSLFVGFLFSAMIWQNYEKIVNRNLSFNAFKEQSFFCEAMADVPATERLPVAIAMNIVNQLSDECLDRESDFVLWRQKKGDTSLAYYAKSLTAIDDAKELLYKNQACLNESEEDYEKLSLGCRVARAFQYDETEKLYSSLVGQDVLSDVLRYEVGIILDKENELQDNFKHVARHKHIKQLRKYQISELLWQMSSQQQPRRIPASFSTEEKVEDIINTESANQKILDLLESM